MKTISIWKNQVVLKHVWRINFWRLGCFITKICWGCTRQRKPKRLKSENSWVWFWQLPNAFEGNFTSGHFNSQYFFATFRNHTFLYPCIHHGTARFIPNSFVAAACFQPTSVELHQTWTFEGCSTNWATLPLTKEQHSVSRLAGRTSDMDSATKKALSTKLTVSGKTK